MLISCDDRKNESNFAKHGVWFEEPQTVLFDPLLFSYSNLHPDGNRMEYLGKSEDFRLLYVVTVEEVDDEIRIISARKDTSNERKKYEEGI
jgi:uncharacterized DUF497 family protein